MKKIIRFRPLLSEIARQQRQQKTTILFIPSPKMLSKVVQSCCLSMGVKFLLGLDAELMRFYILACRNGVYRHDKNKQRYFFIFVMDIFLFQWTKVLLKHPVQTAIQKIICLKFRKRLVFNKIKYLPSKLFFEISKLKG